MPAKSKQQQRLFGLALSVKRGETPRSDVSDEVLDMVDSMSDDDIEDYASTKHKGLPTKKEHKTMKKSELRQLIREEIKQLIERTIPSVNLSKKDISKLNKDGELVKTFSGSGFKHSVDPATVKTYKNANQIQYIDYLDGKAKKVANVEVEHDKVTGILDLKITK